MWQHFKGYRTIIVNVLLALPAALPLLMQILIMPEFPALIPVEYKPFYTVFVAMVNVYLRFQTDTAVGKKE